jgi:glycine dehydrogenase subunit 2
MSESKSIGVPAGPQIPPTCDDRVPALQRADSPLLFEIGSPGLSGAALPKADVPKADRSNIPALLLADAPPPLPEVGELDVVRHYKHLAHRCFSIDGNFYPLGSCTMKYNPRVNERVAFMPGFAHLHPYQDEADLQGMLELLYRLRIPP